MNHYILSYQIEISGERTFSVTAGSVVPDEYYMEHSIGERILDAYKKQFPDKIIEVSFLKHIMQVNLNLIKHLKVLQLQCN